MQWLGMLHNLGYILKATSVDPPRMKKQSIHWWGWLAIIFTVIASCEFLSYLATSALMHRNLIFCPLHITESYENYQERLLPTLGWPTPNYVQKREDFYDASGARFTPAFPDPYQTPARISLYGDSFTEAWGVDHEHAWGNVLSLLLNCRVSNFGVAGYGTDQAYLRFLQNTQDPAKVVVLVIFPENIKRNVNQLRNLISNVSICQTKPRFTLNNQGQLTLVPIPSLTKSEYYEVQYNPGRFFHHEFFLPDGPSGRQMAKFPYLWGMIKTSYFVLKNLGKVDKYQDFFQPGHPSRGLEIMVAIIKAFCDTAQKRGKRPLVMIIPTHYDIMIYQRYQKWNYQPLLDRLTDSHMEYIDAGPKIIQKLHGADRRTLYYPKLSFHLTGEGNHLLAVTLHDFLTSRNIMNQKN
jgi:lysophospholipase L1-like esterase